MRSRKLILGIVLSLAAAVALFTSHWPVRVASSPIGVGDTLQISALLMRVRAGEALVALRANPGNFVGIIRQAFSSRVDIEAIDSQRAIARPQSNGGIRLILPPGILGCSDILLIRNGKRWRIGGMYGGTF